MELTPAWVCGSTPSVRSRARATHQAPESRRGAPVFGATYRCVDLETLIHLKRAAGRPKDFEAIAELEALLEERSKA
jgi:hypothetical protein